MSKICCREPDHGHDKDDGCTGGTGNELKFLTSHRGTSLTVVLLLGLLVATTGATGCPPDPPDPPDDTTPPGFIAIQADYIRVSDGFNTGTETIPVGGFTKMNKLGSDRRLRLVATVGDSESGIESVSSVAEIAWTCTEASGEKAQLHKEPLDPLPNEELTGTAPTGTPSLRNATFLVDPFHRNPPIVRCLQSDDQSPAVLTMTITVRNGKKLTASTGKLVFTWAGRPPGP